MASEKDFQEEEKIASNHTKGEEECSPNCEDGKARKKCAFNDNIKKNKFKSQDINRESTTDLVFRY